VAGSGTDEAVLHENAQITAACATVEDSIAMVPVVTATAINLVFELFITRLSLPAITLMYSISRGSALLRDPSELYSAHVVPP
jgi:hypothetical protein